MTHLMLSSGESFNLEWWNYIITGINYVIIGAKSTGKTSIIHQLIYGKISNVDSDTIKDIRSGSATDNELGNAKEKVHLIDTHSLVC